VSSDLFRAKWNELESKIQLHFDKLSAEDVLEIAGDDDKLMRILHTCYGYNDEQAQDAWDRFVRRYGRG
jgi:hypothetical protein